MASLKLSKMLYGITNISHYYALVLGAHDGSVAKL